MFVKEICADDWLDVSEVRRVLQRLSDDLHLHRSRAACLQFTHPVGHNQLLYWRLTGSSFLWQDGHFGPRCLQSPQMCAGQLPQCILAWDLQAALLHATRDD
ncbi:hypothetical protein TYRP_023530 [Tyrophagus putrescentiae]|nr:hypothetical protein TYRP_023530 [Tyrophagus putrescentiae]